MDKKLLVIRVTDEVVAITAAFKNSQLYIASVKTHKLKDKKANQRLIDEVATRKKNGFIVVVDEPFLLFSRGVTVAKLANTDNNGKPRLVNALNAYYHLSAKGVIEFAAGVKNIKISDSLVNTEYVDGEEKYLIDWDMIKAVELAMLLACYSCSFSFSTNVNHIKGVLYGVRQLQAQGKQAPRAIAT